MPRKEKKLIFSTLVFFLIRYSKSHIFASKNLIISNIDLSFDMKGKFHSLIVKLCMFNYMQNQDQSKGLKLNFFQAHYILCGKLTLRKILLGMTTLNLNFWQDELQTVEKLISTKIGEKLVKPGAKISIWVLNSVQKHPRLKKYIEFNRF